MSKLYRVTMEYDFIVAADDDIDAYRAARASVRDVVNNQEPDNIAPWASPIETIDQIPKVWRGCIPYGGDGDAPVEEYLS